MADILVDSNVILDVVTEDPKWYEWSGGQLEKLAEHHSLVINPIVYSEVSIGFDRIEDLDQSLPPDFFRRDPLPWEAGFLAGKCFVRYRRSGGKRRSPPPDFYIGAHAAIRGIVLLTHRKTNAGTLRMGGGRCGAKMTFVNPPPVLTHFMLDKAVF